MTEAQIYGAILGLGIVFMVAAVSVSSMSLWISMQNQITVKAMEKSTHSIQYVDADSVKTELDKELNGEYNAAEHDEWDRMDEIHEKNEPLM